MNNADTQTYNARQAHWRLFAGGGGALAIIAAALVLLGWIFDWHVLTGVLPGAATMKINTAIGFVLSGAVLTLLATGARSRARAAIVALCAATVTLLGAITLLQELIGADFGIDDVFGTRISQRMAPATAVAFMLYGAGALLRDARLRFARNLAEALALAVASIGLIALLGYAYDVAALYQFYSYASMALHTALLFVLLGLGLLAVRPNRGLAAVVTSEQGGGLMARRLLPFALGVPFVLGWLRLWGERQGFYGNEFGLAISTSSNIVVFAILVWLSARSLNRKDAEHQHVDEALKISEQRVRDIIDGLGPYMFVGLMTVDGTLLEANRPALVAAGLKPADVLGKRVEETYWWNYSDEVKQQLRAAIARGARGEASRYDVKVRAAENQFIIIDFSIQPLRDRNGEVVFLVPSAIVITERKQAEEALRIGEERLRLAVTGAGLGTWHWDIASGELLWSQHCLAIFGLAPDSAMSYDKFLNALHPEDRAMVDSAVRRALDTHSEYQIECRTVWPDGSEHWIASNGRGYYDADGRPLRMEGVAWDITPRMRAQLALHEVNESLEHKVAERTALLQAIQAELRTKNAELKGQNQRVQEATRLKSEFLANMSHELRTPLNAIIGFSELMHDGKVGAVSAEHKEYLGDVLISAKHLLQLINDMLDLAKIEAGKLEFKPEPIDLMKTLGEVRDVVRALILSRHLRVTIEIDPSLAGVVADVGKLKQVLYNYLSNATKFSKDAGAIGVRVRPEGARQFRLEVEDHGVGIKVADVDRLFGEFQQLDTGTAKRYAGTGLGLALTKRIVEAQGGCVGVASEIGKGSVFYAVLPRVLGAAYTTPRPRRISGTGVRGGNGG